MTTTATTSGNRSNGDYIFEDDMCVAYNEISNQQSPVHFVVAPKRELRRNPGNISAEDEKLLGHLVLVARQVALEQGLSGYHVVIDEDQRFRRLKCLHVFGRALHHMVWPTGPGYRL